MQILPHCIRPWVKFTVASSPYERVKKLARQSRDWIEDYAKMYKKKAKLERAVHRFQTRYQNALDQNGCRRGTLNVANSVESINYF